MTRPRSRLDIARLRLQNQHLGSAPLAEPEDVVRWLCAVQAQDHAGAKWGVAQRTAGCTDAQVEEAFAAGRILRTHVLRPTWHFVMPDDIRWMLGLTGPRIIARMSPYDRKLELDEPLFARAGAAIGKALRGGRHLTRQELAAALADAGIRASGQRLAHIAMRAELDAIACSGPRRGKQFTYAQLDERAPAARSLPRDRALAELSRRYFASHGPAQVQDFAWWSGLTVVDARAGIESAGLERSEVAGKTYWFAASGPSGRVRRPLVHLLPNYDEYLIAYRDHSNAVDAGLLGALGGLERETFFMNHIVVLDGQVVGGWTRTAGKDGVLVDATPLTALGESEKKALRAAVERYARFLGVPVRLSVASAKRRGTRRG